MVDISARGFPWLSMPGDVSGLDEQTVATAHHACYMAVCAARMTFVKKRTCAIPCKSFKVLATAEHVACSAPDVTAL